VKRIYSVILALIYLIATTGATIHQHYCMGELVGFSLFDLTDQKCGKCGMEKHTEASKDCCQDVAIVVKAGDSHTYSSTFYDLSTFSVDLPAQFEFISGIPVLPETFKVFPPHGPPVLKIPLFIQYCTYRI
jgi:hypothetical protein